MISKILVIICSLFLINNLFSQKRESIYLEFSKPYSISKDKDVLLEMYKLTFNSCKQEITTMSLENDNKIVKHIIVKSNSKPTLIFLYNSFQNPIKKINFNSDINFLSIDELKNIEPANLIETLKHFKNIFIVDKKKRARKVTFEVLENL